MPDSTAGPAPPDPAAALAGAARNVSRQELIAINWIRFSTATFLVSLHLVDDPPCIGIKSAIGVSHRHPDQATGRCNSPTDLEAAFQHPLLYVGAQQFAFGVAFSLGLVIIAVALVRMSQVIIGEHVDMFGLAIWGAVEAVTAIVVWCFPALKGFLARRVRKYHGAMSSRQKHGTRGDSAEAGSATTP
ncbi:hypothetical protein S40285_08682 [Stachybotrys chlorohalonatus IBT 40285]|uniref:Uncharacterized protein n=1 Tax=Stachybotrys chlorohalonatus (strain IBT 40285) TaxID=1283841 RepID=A0A084QWX4_STAC4|nr:hypothetical protein S40285_08682 [Stachybotrys chlorohalonata IBT 40285]